MSAAFGGNALVTGSEDGDAKAKAAMVRAIVVEKSMAEDEGI